ncbi:MAG: hypothetical protein F4186_04520 [Boseongicola sp. SB0676_bin_33]|nr:hypothetical protein [Boseongicola sp. SB0676_bin_33]
MRTTLNIDDEILEAARSIAGERNLSVGAALSELARLGRIRGRARKGNTRPRFRRPIWPARAKDPILTRTSDAPLCCCRSPYPAHRHMGAGRMIVRWRGSGL